MTAKDSGGWLYYTIKFVLFIYYKLFFHLRCYGADKVPGETSGRGVILAPNHASYLDPPLLGVCAKRRVTFLAKEYLFNAFFVGWVLRTLGAVPIKTQADDFRNIRKLIKLLQQGRCIEVFPEGTRSPDGNLQEPESGVGFLAIKSGAAVIPVYIDGTYQAWPRGANFFKCHPVRVYLADPFVPALDKSLMQEKDPYAAVSRKIMAEIAELKSKVLIQE